MLINFELVPIEKIQPWGPPGDLSLSWFGLTDGQYWIDVGDSKLFEYTELVRRPGEPRYCDYQVVRLHEDLIDMLPNILDPVPSTLTQNLSGDSARAWRDLFDVWFDQNQPHCDSDQFWEIVDNAATWSGKRKLDSAYLSPSADIAIWSDDAKVHFEWDNRMKLFNGQQAWTALHGKYQLPRDHFVQEIQSFHNRLITQMAQRVDQVLAGAISAEIAIDLAGLVRDQKERSLSLEKALMTPATTDWHAVKQSINRILKEQRAP